MRAPRRELNVNDAPVSGPRRGTRPMKEQRTEGEGGTLARETERLSLFGTNAIDSVRSQPPEAMRTTADSDRSIVDRARIEVQTKRQACSREVDRRLNVRTPAVSVHGPKSATWLRRFAIDIPNTVR